MNMCLLVKLLQRLLAIEISTNEDVEKKKLKC